MTVTYQRQDRISRRGTSHFGEVLALRALSEALDEAHDQQTHIICNAVVPDGQASREVDLIIISPFGVAAIEVKFFNDPVEFVGQSKTLRCPKHGAPVTCRPEPRDQARRAALCLHSLISQSLARDMDRFSVAVNGMLLFANERQVLNGNPGVVVAVELLKPGVSKIVSGEFARTHRADNWQHPLSKEQIQRVAECILGAKVSEPMQTIDRYELLEQLCSFEPLEFRARCTLPGAPKEEEFRLRRHNLGLLAQDNERERVWRLVWREYQALRKLAKQHVRGIPLPHDPFFDPDDDTVAWTVSEHIPGRPLYERVSDRPLPIGPVLAQLAAALSQAHAGGLIHRHFTPDALWIASSDDSAWILHWDLARMIEQQTISSQIRDRLRKDSRYLAPEVRDRPDRVSPASDLYSFAVVALELLQGAVLMTDRPEEAQAVASNLPRSNLPIAQCQKLLSAAVSPETSERGGLAALGASLAGVTLTSSLHS